MAAPSSWSAPSSGGTYSTASDAYGTWVSHAGSYWFAISREATGGAIVLRYASDPTGAWSTATLPTAPTGYTSTQSSSRYAGVQFDGTDYAFVIGYSNGSANKWRVVYATSPSGTWTAYEFDTSDLYQPSNNGLIYANSTWVLVGRYLTTSPQPPFIATASTASGTYTFNTSASTTGYDTTTLTGTGTRYFDITGIAYSGSRWVTAADTNSGPTYLRTSTSLTSSWAAPTTAPSINSGNRMRYWPNGWWSFIEGTSAWVTDDPTDAWTELTATTLGVENSLGNLAYGARWWIAATSYLTAPTEDAVRISYLAGSGSADGTYTFADATGFFDSSAVDTFGSDVAFDPSTGYFVAAATYQGEVRYYLAATGPTYLRLHQSPVMAPSRVRPPQLRQRQRPEVTT